MTRHLHVATRRPNLDGLRLVTSTQLMAYAGITYRQLDYWTRTGALHAHGDINPGSGYPRSYLRAEADVALNLRRLLDAGVSLVAARVAARELAEGQHPRIGDFRLVPVTDEER